MKTTRILSVLGLALIFSSMSVASASSGDLKKSPVPLIRAIRHHVTVYLNHEQPLCNTYLVEILDGSGQRVAPAKVFTPGVPAYDFYERGPVEGIRVAVLVPGPTAGGCACPREIFARPVILKGTFLPGSTYRYDIFPQSQPFKE